MEQLTDHLSGFGVHRTRRRKFLAAPQRRRAFPRAAHVDARAIGADWRSRSASMFGSSESSSITMKNRSTS
jgi:hypothetical protein